MRLSNGTEVQIAIDDSHVLVECTGLAHAIAEVAEQCAWLGAACREHSTLERLGSCSIIIDRAASAGPCVTFAYSLSDLKQESQPAGNASCWRALFRNAVIAHGYPTKRRRQNEQGLEIPLQIMLEIGLTDTVTNYNNGIVIDGLQSMFVPVGRSKDSIQWHFLYSKQEECMMYNEADKVCPGRLRTDCLDESALSTSRHFVGWTTTAETLFGILPRSSKLSSPQDLSLEKFVLTVLV